MTRLAFGRRLFSLPLCMGIGLLPPRMAAAQNPNVDVLNYTIAVAIADSTNLIQGKTAVQLRCIAPVDTIELNLRQMRVQEALVQAEHTGFRQADSLLLIAMPRTVRAGDTLLLRIVYSGIPEDGLIIRKNKYGHRTFFVDNWPNRAQYWFPCVDHPSDKAGVDLEITAPSHYGVVANGRHLRTTYHPNGMRTVRFREATPMPTYCIVFGAAIFDHLELGEFAGVPMSLWVFPEDVDDALHDFRRAGEMLRYYAERFGPFPFAKLAHVQSSTRFGGMENAGAIFYAEKSIGTQRNIEGTVAHETAHQWFGDHVTVADWAHLWLSEGFATYFGMQFFEHADGKSAFQERMAERRMAYLRQDALHNRAIVEPVPSNLFTLLNANNYTKGGWVLHMLRDIVGDEAFWRGIRLYAERYAGKNAVTEDLRETMEETSEQTLDWFFTQWVFQPGIPDLQIAPIYDADTRTLELTVHQRQARLMRFPLEIATDVTGEPPHRFWVEKREQRFRLPMKQRPASITADPRVRLLAKIQIDELL